MDGGQLIALSGAVLGVGDDVVVVVMRSWSWYRGRASADGGSAGWPVSMASSLAVRISGEVSRSRCVHRLVVRVPWRSKPSGGGLRHISAPSMIDRRV